MELDNKQKVLIAIYTEYQKENFNMENIRHSELGMRVEDFGNALIKLKNEEYIKGDINITRGGMENNIQNAVPRDLLITQEGIKYVENKLAINTTDNNKSKLESVKTKLLDVAWDKGSEFAAKVLAEMIIK